MTSPGGREVGRISIRIVPDTSLFRKELKAELEAIEKSMKATVPVELDLDSRGAKTKFDALLAELKARGAKGVTIETKVDKDRLGNLFGSAAGGGAAGANGLLQMSQSLGLVAAVAALAAPALALISGALTTLPAVASAVLIPVAAIALGLDGLKKAAEVLKPDLDSLKEVMSAKFQDVFTPILTNLKTLFPKLEESMPAVAQGLGDMASSFVNVVTSAPGMAAIQGTIGNIAKTLSAAAPGVGTFTSGLLNLANKVSSKFPAVSTWFDKVGTSFDNWVTKMSTIDSSGTSPLDRAMDNLGGTLKGVLDIVGDLAKQGFEFLQDPKFGQSMKDFVKSAQYLVNDVLPGLKNFFMDISNSVKTISDTINEIQKFKPPEWLLPDSQNNRENPKNKDGSEKDTSNFFEPFTSKDAPWRTMPAEFRAGFQKEIAVVQGLFTSLWSNLVAGFQAQMAAIPGIFSGIWSTLVAGAQAQWQAVVGVVQGVIGQIGGVLGQVPAALSSAWSSLSGIASQAFNSVVTAVQNAFSQAVQAVVTGAGQIISEVASLPGKIAAAAGNFAGALVGAGKALMDGLLSGIRAGLEAVLSFASGIAAKIAAVKGPLPKDRKTLTPAGEALMQGLGDGLDNGLSPILQQAKDMATQIFQAFKDVFGSAPAGVSFNIGGSGGTGGPLGALPTQMSQLSSTSADFSKNMTSGVAGVGKLTDETKQQTADLQAQIDTLELQRKSLAVQKDQAGDKGTKSQLQDQIDALNVQKRQLDLQKGQLAYNDKYNGSLTESNTQLQDMAKSGQSLLTNFAKANTDQLMSDLGIGGGAITGGLQAGLDWGTQFASQFTFNVANTDDAIAIKNNQINKQSLQFQGR